MRTVTNRLSSGATAKFLPACKYRVSLKREAYAKIRPVTGETRQIAIAILPIVDSCKIDIQN
ncbi:MAG TPA: hypothetical protein VJJ22_02740 [Candidatus Paceibacterota bacterium]